MLRYHAMFGEYKNGAAPMQKYSFNMLYLSIPKIRPRIHSICTASIPSLLPHSNATRRRRSSAVVGNTSALRQHSCWLVARLGGWAATQAQGRAAPVTRAPRRATWRGSSNDSGLPGDRGTRAGPSMKGRLKLMSSINFVYIYSSQKNFL